MALDTSFEASTLVETITALVIAAVIFGMTTVVVANLWSSGADAREIRAQTMVEAVCNAPEYLNQWNTDPAFELVLEEPTNTQHATKIIRVSAITPGGEVIAVSHRIVEADETF